MRLRLLVLSIAAWTMCLAGGCGNADRPVEAKGSLVLGGEPFDAQAYDPLTVILYPATEGGTAADTFPANLTDDGTFTVPGREGNGVPPGKYRISIEAMTHPDRKHLRLPADIRGPQSRLSYELAPGKEDIGVIDLAKP